MTTNVVTERRFRAKDRRQESHTVAQDRRSDARRQSDKIVNGAREEIAQAVHDYKQWLERLYQQPKPGDPATVKQYPTVFVLRRNEHTLEIFASVKSVFDAAQLIIDADPQIVWKQSRPGRWWSLQGSLEVEEWELKP